MSLKRYVYIVLAVIIGCCQYLSAYADGTITNKVVGTPVGEFSVSPLGGAVYTMSIDVPKGYGKMQPNIALVYNSQSGYGIAGYGINVSGLSMITRGTKDIYHDGAAKGMSHVADDAYYLDGKRLIYQSGNKGQEGAVYVPEGEPYTKVTFHGTYNDTEANTWIEVVTQDGITYQYGRYDSSRLSYRTNGKPRIHAWLVNRATDVMGRYINYTYQKSALNCIPSVISYGMNGGVTNTVSFAYESIRNGNTQLINIDGQQGKVTSRLKSITTASSGKTYRTYECVYDSTLDASKTRYSRLTQLIEKNGNGEALNPIRLSWNGLPTFTTKVVTPNVDVEAKDFMQVIDSKVFLCADMNGDGISDIIKVANIKDNYYSGGGQTHFDPAAYAYIFLSEVSSDGSVAYHYSKSFNLGGIVNLDEIKANLAGATSLDMDGDGKADVVIRKMVEVPGGKALDLFFITGSMQRIDGVFYLRNSSELPLTLSLDVNKDGKDEYFCLEKKASDGKYHGGFIHLDGTMAFADYTFQLKEQPLNVFAADYNSDGLPDLIFLHEKGYTVYYNQGGNGLSSAYDESHKLYSTSFKNQIRIVQGDFNGDGLTDFAYFQQDWDFFFALNNGDGSFELKKAATLDITDRDTKKDDGEFSLLPYDMDGDGKTDLLIVKGDFKKHHNLTSHYYRYSKTQVAWLRSDGEKLILDKEYTFDSEDDAWEKDYMLGCFSTDGQMSVLHYGKDFVNFNSSDPVKMRFVSNSSYSLQSGKLVAVTDGMGNSHNITYGNLLNPSSYTHQYDAKYPMVDVHIALPVVKSVSSTNGAAGVMTQEYSYAGLKAHEQGKGLLGFAKSIAKNNTLGETVETDLTAWNTDYLLPSQTKTLTSLGGSQASSISTYTITAKNGTYFSYPSSTVDKDLDGFETKTVTKYDTDKGCLLSQTQYFDGDDMYKQQNYANYQQKGGVYLPQVISSVQKHHDNTSSCLQVTNLSYDNNGQLTKKIENAQSSLALTTQYVYDKFGNVLSTTQSGKGVPALTHINTYDATGRFVVKTSQNPAALTTEYTNDVWGNVVRKTEYADASNPQVTSYSYDGWNRVVSSVDPMGIKKTVTYENSGSSYRIVQNVDNGPSSYANYDAKGRVLVSQTDIEGNLKKTVTYQYNALGQKTLEQEIYGSVRHVQHYSYDNRGRLVEHTDETKGTKLSYQYDGRTTTTLDGGKTYVKEVDAWGNVKRSSDPVSEVSYTYASNGQPSLVTTNGSSVKMTYDDVGNKISMEDPDAGTVSYSYAADGKIQSQTDARGIETLYTYDVWGKLLQKQVGDMTFVNIYGTSGIENGLLVKKALGNYYEEYTHDKYGRLVKKVRNAYSKKNFVTEYAYNSKNQLEKVIYPGGLAVTYVYDSKGFPTSSRSNGLVLDSLVNYNGYTATHLLPYGMTYKKTLAGKLTLQNLNIQKSGKNLFNMDFKYDAQSGNLLSRTGMLPEEEAFEYDVLDRLMAVKAGNSTSLNISYANNGNIMSKTDVGNYTYSSVKPHAVMDIDNANAYQYTSDMTTEYNDMGRIKLISQRQTYPINMKFTYGADGSLWNVDYTPSVRSTDIGGHRAWSRYYDDNYEYLYSALYRRDFYYLNDHVIAVRDNDKEFKFYVVAKDNLGSIVGIYNANGDKVFSASYDAWGKQTVSDTSDDMHLMLRGYCGHTMLNEFDLIDMKGRLYDPVVGRFLSPDNYVQLPDNSQNYNRYSYCLNNPLKYTDPSGEIFWFPIAIGAAIGAYAGASIQSHNLAFWKWSSHAWQGAIAGAFVGASLGAGVAAATGQSGISFLGTDGAVHATKAWSITTTLINGGTVNMGLHLGNGWDGAWKAALVGTAAAAWTHTGGFGLMNKLKQVHGIAGALGRIGYQMTGTLAASIGNNWAGNQGLFSKLTLGVGPVNLTLGRGQNLLQLSNNIGNVVGNLAGLVNVGFDFSKIHWDSDNLTFNSVGGIADIMYPEGDDNAGMTIFSIWGNRNLSKVYAHELVHLWEERSMYGNYFPNYVVHGVYSLLGGYDFLNSNFKEEGINAYEQEAELYPYWNY